MNSEMVFNDVFRGVPIDLRKIEPCEGRGTTGVYLIYCEPAKRYYVGSSIDCETRIRSHLSELRSGWHRNKNLSSDAKAFGVQSLSAFVVEKCGPSELETKEDRWIRIIGIDRLYNIQKKANRTRMHTSEYEKTENDSEYTIDTLRKDIKKETRAFQIAWKAAGLSNYKKNRFATKHEELTIREYYNYVAKRLGPRESPFSRKKSVSNAKRGNPVGESASRPPASVVVEKTARASIASNWEFDSINLIEMGLIGWGLWLLYDVSGLFLAAMCCLFIYKTQRLVKQPKMAESSEKALEVIWWLCAASCILHSITFYKSINIHHSGTGDPLLYVHLCAAIIPAVFVSAFSYKAVATTRTITEEQ